ncbi:MAG: lamin tail domain-containing protein, partial [Patescibacteria group bacterium]
MKKLFFLALCLLIWPVLFFAYGAELVDINTASLAQLDNLVGIGPALGQRIIDNRPYASVDDLLKVQGIGPKNLEKIKQQSLACVNCQGLMVNTSTESATTTTTTITTQATEQTVKPSPLPPENIFLSEILPSPEGSDTENEFIEIFNANNFEIDLSSWKIKDKVGAVKSYSLPENTKINANGFLVLKSSQTKISLNNSGDGVELLGPSGKIIDSTDFGKS